MYTISKEFSFSGAHHLAGLPDEHPCSRPHGHNYTVQLWLEREKLDDTGFVLDYGAMAPFGDFLDDKLDHRDLNEVVGFNPTAENLAAYLFTMASAYYPGLVLAVGVQETPKTIAIYRRE